MPLTDGEGSSPLSRGIRLWSPPHGGAVGIIPALAGNTRPCRRCGWRWRDHPRSRGEYRVRPSGSSMKSGSSPLSRGIPDPDVEDSRGGGIIPALAGNTSFPGLISRNTRDHPRSRGEYTQQRPPARHHAGSSPLSRGILLGLVAGLVILGIIPALAGNTCSAPGVETGTWDHPRSRGEYDGREAAVSRWSGSSPLSRGIPWRWRIRG